MAVKIKSPAQLANYLEKHNPKKAKGVLLNGVGGRCAIGVLAEISGIDDAKVWMKNFMPRELVEGTWLCAWSSRSSLSVSDRLVEISDGSSGWTKVIEFLRKLRSDGTFKKGAQL